MRIVFAKLTANWRNRRRSFGVALPMSAAFIVATYISVLINSVDNTRTYPSPRETASKSASKSVREPFGDRWILGLPIGGDASNEVLLEVPPFPRPHPLARPRSAEWPRQPPPKQIESAKIDLQLDTKMMLGETYEARLEILRPGTAALMITSNDKKIVSETYSLSSWVRASIDSAHLTVERLSDEWQDIASGSRGFWHWRIKPNKTGPSDIVLTVQDSDGVLGREQRRNVIHLDRTIQVDATLWGRIRAFTVDLSPIVQMAIAIPSALAAAAFCFVGWLRRRRERDVLHAFRLQT